MCKLAEVSLYRKNNVYTLITWDVKRNTKPRKVKTTIPNTVHLVFFLTPVKHKKTQEKPLNPLTPKSANWHMMP